MRLLLIEDDHDLLAALNDYLCPFYSIDQAQTGQAGVSLAQINQYDLIILDIGLPDINGIKICEMLRKEKVATPILILTANLHVSEKVTSLDLGADDYVTKPFNLDELRARIRALIRRGPRHITSVQLEAQGLVLDSATRTLHYHGSLIPLKRKEFDILELFLRNQNQIVSREMILEHAWDNTANQFTNAVDVHVGRLRKEIERITGKPMIKTIYGSGYQLDSKERRW